MPRDVRRLNEASRFRAESFESDDFMSACLCMLRRRLSCHVTICPLKDNSGAVAETKRRLSDLSDSVDALMGRAKALPADYGPHERGI